MKSILITGGPTNEPIDEVMKITNMSTGQMAVGLGDIFQENGYKVTLVLNNQVYVGQQNENIKVVRIETTDEMLKALENEAHTGHYHCIIHASAVGDYKADFSFLMEDMSKEIYDKIDSVNSPEDILAIMKNPKCKLNDDTKISSYQENLTVKLGLTPKIIANLRKWFSDSLLIGCKLLENVPKEELFDVATKLCVKNNMDYIMANDLADLRKGLAARYLVDKNGFTGTTLDDLEQIFRFIDEELSK